jgi:flagellar basal body rod protein FlgG
MAGGTYSALSGLRTRLAQLDRIASDIANAGTAGYKTERVPTVEARRPDFGQVLQTAIDVAAAPGLVDFRDGSIQTTNRDLDVALEGRGFFEIETTEGVRYTRNGQFSRRPDGTLVTADGAIVRGDTGTAITVGQGAISFEPDGSVRAGGVLAGKLKVVDFGDYVGLRREDAGRFRAEAGSTPVGAPATARVRGGSLESSNVQLPERMVQLTEVSRAFEALQRGITTLMNDVDGRAISELGRR